VLKQKARLLLESVDGLRRLFYLKSLPDFYVFFFSKILVDTFDALFQFDFVLPTQ
jgi:hypothetical protein